jgi:hypothetical protein
LLFGLPSGQGALSETYDFSHLKDIAVDESKCNLTPYGFNGIFTNQKNGGLLNNGFYVYSPSGLYPASDMWASDSIKKVMQ